MAIRDVSSEILLKLYATMFRIRVFEEHVSALYKQGEIPGFIHLYNGEEAVAAGVCAHLRDSDMLTSTHRGHGHVLAKGCRPDKVMAELFGKKDGYCGGRGGSMHLYSVDNGVLGTNGIVGGGIPLAVGAGLKFKCCGQDNVSIAFLGDGASNMGVFYESLNHASIYNLPVIFVCENNLYATSTPFEKVTACTEIAKRASVFNIPGIAVDGNDVTEVFDVASEAVAKARCGKGPTLIEAKTYRHVGHHEGEPIYGTYRTQKEVESWIEKCPIKQCRNRLLEEHKIPQEEIDTIDQNIQKEIDDAIHFARNSGDPDPNDAECHVFSEV